MGSKSNSRSTVATGFTTYANSNSDADTNPDANANADADANPYANADS